MYVDAVEQWSRDFRNVALDHRLCAVAFAGAVVVKSAGTGIHRGGEHEARGKGQRHGGPRDADSTVLKRLAHDFKDVAREFRKFVEKQNTFMSERNFARPRDCTTADQACV